MKTFNILGCCVLRDIFRIVQDSELKVNKFIQFVSPMSFMEEPQNCNRISMETLAGHEEWSNFCKRNVTFDFNKTVLQTIREAPTDYILIDLSELRFALLRCTFTDGSSCLLTAVKYQKTLAEECMKNNGAPAGIVCYEEWKPTPEEMQDTIRRYAAFLSELYDEKHIIVVENYMQFRHIDDHAQRFHEYSCTGIRNQNEKLAQCFDYLKEFLPAAHYIRMPDHCLGDAGHLWGKDPLHFTDTYYRYLYQAIRIIIDEAQDKEQRMDALRDMYSAHFALLEKQKRMEYYIAGIGGNENLLTDGSFETAHLPKDDPRKQWYTSFSKGACYEKEEHLLICGNEPANWAILQQDIDLEALRGKMVCLSVKFKTFSRSTLNLTIRYKTPDSKLVYLASKQCCCDDYVNIDSLVASIPEEIDAASAHVAVYCNKHGGMIQVLEMKLETGNSCSLF